MIHTTLVIGTTIMIDTTIIIGTIIIFDTPEPVTLHFCMFY